MASLQAIGIDANRHLVTFTHVWLPSIAALTAYYLKDTLRHVTQT